MARKKKQVWRVGDVVAVRLRDGRSAAGQVLAPQEFGGFVPMAFFDLIVMGAPGEVDRLDLSEGTVIGALAVGKLCLDSGEWPVLGNRPVLIPEARWPNAQFRHPGSSWIGAKMYDAGIAEDLLNAWYGLIPWDSMHDPMWFDKLLFPGRQRSRRAVFKRDEPT